MSTVPTNIARDGAPSRTAQRVAALLALGFGSAASATADVFNRRYSARRKDGLCTGGSVQIMRAIK